MKKYKILALAIFACVTLNGWAQSEDNVTGRVLDEKGKPVAGALVSVEENPLVRVATDKNGRFEITAVKGTNTGMFCTQNVRYKIKSVLPG